MIPTVFTTAFYFFQGNQRVIAAAVVGGLSSLAPTLGPTVGGWITENYSWHWLFFVNLVPGIFVAVAVPLMVRIDKPDPSLLKRADYLGMALMAIFLATLEYTLEEGARWSWFFRRHHPPHRLDLRHHRRGLHSPQPYLCGSSGRPARTEEPQLPHRLPAVLHHRHRHLRNHLPDTGVPGARARLQCGADRPHRAHHRHRAGGFDSGVHVLRAPLRSALVAAGRRTAVRRQHVELRADHARLGLARAAAAAGTARLRAAVRRRAHGDADTGRAGAASTQARFGSLQPDAQPRRRHRHRGLRHAAQRPHQPAFRAPRRAHECGRGRRVHPAQRGQCRRHTGGCRRGPGRGTA